ncbi:MAG: hypothetical protein GX803_08290 [Lentisphaerae bacterium]|jgi:hypothetical protein|nr:hypothetical protein [Lentisphaerota bacterium]
MKKWLWMGLAAWMTVSAQAQHAGLPIGSTAGVRHAGATSVSGGTLLSDDFNAHGGRLTFSPFGRFALFGDLAVLDPDHGDLGLAVQAGGLLTLPVSENLVDIGLRATWSHAGHDIKGGDVQRNAFALGLVFSREFKWLSPYCYAGGVVEDKDVNTREGKRSKDRTYPSAAGGARLNLTRQLALLGEVAHARDWFASVGLNWTF